mmetsp:Transcript_6643/g.15066  ORF Transcript_6643/g.15066 Transcript_6643/m.15066 type:complete len:207 (+) Transcript_6643:557-1177(+)
MAAGIAASSGCKLSPRCPARPSMPISPSTPPARHMVPLKRGSGCHAGPDDTYIMQPPDALVACAFPTTPHAGTGAAPPGTPLLTPPYASTVSRTPSPSRSTCRLLSPIGAEHTGRPVYRCTTSRPCRVRATRTFGGSARRLRCDASWGTPEPCAFVPIVDGPPALGRACGAPCGWWRSTEDARPCASGSKPLACSAPPTATEGCVL